jgi:lipopolysaccharide transport system ATP-binding protein
MSAITASNLGKAYRTYRRPIDSLKEVVFRRPYAETFWAIRGINLDVPVGGSLGIVGDNGAGKTTLLKLLAGATKATEGTVERGGRASAILSLGAGFHADLTGAENIRIGCAVLGLSPAETEAVTPAVIEFSELGAFIDKPLKTYSSGMYLRLGFSVATAVNPEILIVDEHLSVGDQHFRYKCMRRIMALRERGCSLVFCSHDMHAVGEVCDRTMWVRDGRATMVGPTGDVLKEYQDFVRARDGESRATPLRASTAQGDPRFGGSGPGNVITSVRLGGDCRNGVIETGGQLVITIMVRLDTPARRDEAHLGVLIVRNDATWCYGVTAEGDGVAPVLWPLGSGDFGAKFIIDELPLLSGEYSLTVALMDTKSPHVYDSVTTGTSFTVRHATKEVGLTRVRHRWIAP